MASDQELDSTELLTVLDSVKQFSRCFRITRHSESPEKVKAPTSLADVTLSPLVTQLYY